MTHNILVVTTLYPNQIQFRHGIFVETRIRHLQLSGKVNITVIAPVPWFPVKSTFFPEYSKLVDVPDFEIRHEISIYHPRYWVIPKIGMSITPFFLAWSIYRQIAQLQKEGHSFDLIDAHYYFPDGVAAAIIAKLLKIPLIITARGSDINQIADFYLPRKMILWASKIARFNLAVCNALIERMIELGVPKETTLTVRNGVNLQLFQPLANRDILKQKWLVKQRLLISVGFLIERKGHHLIIEALPLLPDYQLFIAGGGEWADKLKALVQNLGLQDRVRFLGEVRQQQLVELYNCADALILASSREGWANVLLEAMACGTPVVATNIWGTPEVVQTPEAGVLCRERTAPSIAEAVQRLFSAYPDRLQTRHYAERFSWDETTRKILEIFERFKMPTEDLI